MRSISVITESAGLRVEAVRCTDDHTRWSPAEAVDEYRIVFVRAGRFRWWSGGTAADADSSTAYLSVPGQEERFAHPVGGDTCLAIRMSADRWRGAAGDAPVRGGAFVYTGGPVDLARPHVLAAARAGDADYAVADAVHRLVDAAVGRPWEPVSAGAAARTLVRQAREALTAGDPSAATLASLARALHVSPSWLSRTFSAVTGTSITRFRNDVRVGRALERLAAGDHDLATLAASLGFADHAHLTRTVRSHLGATPSAIRRSLSLSATRAWP